MIKLTFTEEEVNTILFALAKEPYIEVTDLIQNIHEQYENAQDEKGESKEI